MNRDITLRLDPENKEKDFHTFQTPLLRALSRDDVAQARVAVGVFTAVLCVEVLSYFGGVWIGLWCSLLHFPGDDQLLEKMLKLLARFTKLQSTCAVSQSLDELDAAGDVCSLFANELLTQIAQHTARLTAFCSAFAQLRVPGHNKYIFMDGRQCTVFLRAQQAGEVPKGLLAAAMHNTYTAEDNTAVLEQGIYLFWFRFAKDPDMKRYVENFLTHDIANHFMRRLEIEEVSRSDARAVVTSGLKEAGMLLPVDEELDAVELLTAMAVLPEINKTLQDLRAGDSEMARFKRVRLFSAR